MKSPLNTAFKRLRTRASLCYLTTWMGSLRFDRKPFLRLPSLRSLETRVCAVIQIMRSHQFQYGADPSFQHAAIFHLALAEWYAIQLLVPLRPPQG